MPFPMKPVIPSGGHPVEKPVWAVPEIQESEDKDLSYALSDRCQDDLSVFESALTKALAAKDIPFVFIQPGAPGHKEAKKIARRIAARNFNGEAPWHPDHQRDF